MRITQWLCWCAGVHHMTWHHQAFSPMEVQLLWQPSSGETFFFINFKWLSGSRSCWEVFCKPKTVVPIHWIYPLFICNIKTCMYIWSYENIYIILHIWTCLCWDSSGSCLATLCINFNPFNSRPLASRGHQSLPASIPRRPVACQLGQWHCELQKSTKHVPQSSRPSSGSSTDWKLNCWGCCIFFVVVVLLFLLVVL